MKLYKSFFLLLIFVFTTTLANAQFATWEIGVTGGGAGYIGDLNQNNPVQISGLSGGVFVKRNFNSQVSFRLHYTYGQIQAQDSKSSSLQFQERNLKFKTSLNDVSTLIDFNFFDYAAGGRQGKRFTPYLFAGVGVCLFKPTAAYNGENYRLDKLKTEGQAGAYKNYTLTIPYGGGIKYNYSGAFSIFSEIGYRSTFTDYLDDVSGVYPAFKKYVGDYPNIVNLSDPSLHGTGEAGSQRGDFRKRDTYLFVSIGISFTFVNEKCYSF